MPELSFIVTSFLAANKNNWFLPSFLNFSCCWFFFIEICKVFAKWKLMENFQMVCFYYLTDCGGHFSCGLCFWAYWFSLLWSTYDFWTGVRMAKPNSVCFQQKAFLHFLKFSRKHLGNVSCRKHSVDDRPSFKVIMGRVAFLTASWNYQRKNYISTKNANERFPIKKAISKKGDERELLTQKESHRLYKIHP